MRIGYFSLPVVGLTAFFTGGVLALQIYHRRQPLRRGGLRAAVVLVGITRELGPVIAGPDGGGPRRRRDRRRDSAPCA